MLGALYFVSLAYFFPVFIVDFLVSIKTRGYALLTKVIKYRHSNTAVPCSDQIKQDTTFRRFFMES